MPLPPNPPPAGRDAPVVIVDHDPEWPRQFEEEKANLEDALADWLAAPPEHVGSTAVPGLAAKPVIDILLPVRDLAAARDAIPVMERSGWLHWAADPKPWRHWFLKPRPEHRTHHAYMIEADHPEARAVVAFRDHLRACREHRDAYAELKRDLASRYREDREAYSEAKSAFVRSVLASHCGIRD